MTMPEGSTQEPEQVLVMEQSIPVRVVSSGKSKNVGAEFGKWRTLALAPGQAPVRLANRSLRRKRLIIKVNASAVASQGASLAAENTVTGPAAGANIVTLALPQGTYSVNWQVGYGAGAVAAAEANNMKLVLGAALVETAVIQAVANVTVPQPTIPVLIVGAGGATLAVQAVALGTATANYEAQLVATPAPSGGQSATDGVIVMDRDIANNVAGPASPAFTPVTFANGGYLQLNDNVRWECQQELWVAPVSTNTGTVYVTTSDEQYASDPETGDVNGYSS